MRESSAVHEKKTISSSSLFSTYDLPVSFRFWVERVIRRSWRKVFPPWNSNWNVQRHQIELSPKLIQLLPISLVHTGSNHREFGVSGDVCSFGTFEEDSAVIPLRWLCKWTERQWVYSICFLPPLDVILVDNKIHFSSSHTCRLWSKLKMSNGSTFEFCSSYCRPETDVSCAKVRIVNFQLDCAASKKNRIQPV